MHVALDGPLLHTKYVSRLEGENADFYFSHKTEPESLTGLEALKAANKPDRKGPRLANHVLVKPDLGSIN